LVGSFELPNFLSIDAKQLIRGILNINPSKRYLILLRMTINDIKMSSFYLKHSNYEEVKGYLPDDVM